MTRTIPATVGNYIELGNFSPDFGAAGVKLGVYVNDSATNSVAKVYRFATSYNQTAGSWNKLLALQPSHEATNNFSIEIKVTNGTYYLRIVKTAGANAGNAVIDLEVRGYDETFKFIETTGTGATCGIATIIYPPSTNQIAWLYGTGAPPAAAGLDDGTLYFKYTP